MEREYDHRVDEGASTNGVRLYASHFDCTAEPRTAYCVTMIFWNHHVASTAELANPGISQEAVSVCEVILGWAVSLEDLPTTSARSPGALWVRHAQGMSVTRVGCRLT